MSESTERLLVRIDATTEQLRREMKKADDTVATSSNKISKSIKKINVSFSGLTTLIAGAGIGLAFSKVFQATAEQERVTAQLNQTLISTGFAAGKTSEELLATASSLQKVTTYGDEAIIGMQSILATFKEIKGDNFDRTTKAILDMSTAMGTSLKSSALQLGKALNDPATQLGALSRAGVTFSESQKEVIKQLAATGQMAEAQTLVLAELESQFGGSAKAARETMGGALAGLSNAWGDLFEAEQAATGPMKESINELEEIISDPEFVGAVHALTAAMVQLGVQGAQALSTLVNVAGFVSDEIKAAFGVIDPGDIVRLGDAVENAKATVDALNSSVFATADAKKAAADELKKYQIALDRAVNLQSLFAAASKSTATVTEKLAKSTAEVSEVTGKAADNLIDTGDAAKAAAKAYKEMVKATDNLADRHEKANDAIQDGVDELDNMVAATEAYIDDLEFEVELLGRTAKEQAVLTAQRANGANATAAQQEQIASLTATLYDAANATEAATAAQDPFQEALQGTAERIDSVFADAWRGAFDSFSDFADGLKNSFKTLLAEMAHLAISRPIVMGITSALGMGSSSGAIGGAGSFFANNSSLYSGGEFSASNAAWSVGGAVAGGLAGNAVYGSTSGAGNALGAVGGSLIPGLPPGVGTAIGSFVGGALEKFGFGEDNNGDNRGISNLNLATGASDVYGVGKSFNQSNVDALTALTQAIEGFAGILGGSSANLSLSAGNNSGFRFQNQEYGSADEMLGAVFDEVVKSAKNLNPYLKKLILNFDGSAEEVANFAQTIVTAFDSIEAMTQQNPANQAIADIEKLNATVYEGYYDQIQVVDNLIATFDGSAASFTDLNNEMVTLQQNAYNLAAAIKGISDDIDSNLTSSASDIRKSVMPQDELEALVRREGQYLEAVLKNTTDPELILRLVQELESRVTQLFSAVDDPTTADAEVAATKLEQINQIAQEQLGLALNSVAESSATINANTSKMLDNFSRDISSAGEQFLTAAQIFLSIAQGSTQNRVPLPGGEVAV